MSDPAVEAAYRYRQRRYPEDDGLVGAAREALKPIREEIDKWEATGVLDYGKLRTLIYASEEST
ncbi:hypothetical protein FDI59_gp044 [Mycobacterium phage Yoshi]|uniref:Uncharacterized protein n=1 Tax=Mycobacterium phage Yoshi TaxID=2920891 RepID=G1BSF1_9CAUD|nr:hypothetical protein FDI59_gp044 [Mycobacterium phage Yoshi]AEK07795.1 hypothetical protein YOSHI_44 [Mycobacterium phage Yoshi]